MDERDKLGKRLYYWDAAGVEPVQWECPAGFDDPEVNVMEAPAIPQIQRMRQLLKESKPLAPPIVINPGEDVNEIADRLGDIPDLRYVSAYPVTIFAERNVASE